MMSETVVTVESGNRNNAQAPPKPAGPQQSSAGPLSWITFNTVYFQSVPGLLKLIQLVLGIICMSLASPAVIASTHWFLFVVVTAFIATLLWVAIYFLGIREVLNLSVNWILTELINTGIFTIGYAITTLFQLINWVSVNYYGRASNITAAVFGLFNTIAYAASTYFLFLEHKAGATH
ncbi:CKLF-like MARVEL transmembrane domain-containing protein 4 [Sitodiplosis mosellana]|uniref:CKLF-like MARVEL transmembrane domain-containing protein 4 n=1 Tax=Sitodiplosis mosellana TaxID=263140 RepID=UPI002443FC74|nr:CKLF-like MARVEL transmembrane domain-containing protein 4 [Sitodiplosis mosellana]